MKNRFVLFLMILFITVVLIVVNAFVQKQLGSISQEHKLVDREFVTEGTPPMIAVSTMALGGFRGIVADVLWLRAMKLQQHARFFELVQLADWILKLQPKFAGAAAYLGWNMSYNISVAMKSPEDRWRWVRRGLLLLQHALELNPNDGELYKEISWIYSHKLGNILDDAQRYYKQTMAAELLFLLGSHYPDWAVLAASPKTEEELLSLFPPEHPLFSALELLNLKSVGGLYDYFHLNGKLPEEVVSVLKEDEIEKITGFFRRKWMMADWCLKPEIVLEINQKFGEFDWLLPESHSVYWAYQGTRYTRETMDFQCERMILQGLISSINYGRMLLPKDGEASEFFLLVPNTELVDAAHEKYKELMTHSESNIAIFKSMYENFLIDTVVTLYSYGQKGKAKVFYDELRNEIGNSKAKSMSFEQFALVEWEEDIADYDFKKANEQLTGLMLQACLLLAYGDRDAAEQHLILAKRVYDAYGNDREGLDRVALPPFNEIKAQVATAIISNFPEAADRLRAEIAADQAKDAKDKTDSKNENEEGTNQ